jgi:hypothetical protein
LPQSDCDDIFRLRTFLAIGHRELHFLAFSQRLEAVASDIAEVCKYIGT